ncbi:sulfur carrier protein ThiS adenylyltransferase ThiF [bacterium]|nr:sulfur carrier protein ThiS adenylyltransferase ThiF [bacterium]
MTNHNPEMPEVAEIVIYARNAPGSFPILKTKCAGIAGCGGLGSNIAVLLARAGVGKLIVADFDTVAPENLNRQHFFIDQIGKLKVDALGDTIKRINPKINYQPVNVNLTPENIPDVFSNVDVLIEAFDKAENKSMLIDTWTGLQNNKLLIAASGLAGTGNIDKIQINKMENLIIVGDFKSNPDAGLMAPKVVMVASMQASLAVEYLLELK